MPYLQELKLIFGVCPKKGMPVIAYADCWQGIPLIEHAGVPKSHTEWHTWDEIL